MNSLLSAIIGHLVGDYLLQNDWMALNKKQTGRIGSAACSVHSIIWTVSVCLFAGWYPFWIILFLYFTHFWQDRTNVVIWWMTRVNRQQKFATGPCAPWSIIVVDNVWHILTLYVAARIVDCAK